MFNQLVSLLSKPTLRRWTACICASVATCVIAQMRPAQLRAQTSTSDKPARELFVPFADLNVLLGSDTRRVFMTRAELEELYVKAERTPTEQLPHQSVLLAANYEAVLGTGRATLQGELQVEVLSDGMHAVPLTLSGVGIRSAQLDDQPAMLAEGPNGTPLLIVEGRGMHTLRLEMVLPVTTAAAQQSLSWQVPVPPSTKFHLSAPGNVEMKSGAAVANRRVDSDAGMTHFDLLPQAGQMALVMSLNNRRLRDETTVLARGVLIDEFTQGYERLHASFSMNILHGASDEFHIAVPDGFEITHVSTPLLARWSVNAADDNTDERILKIELRELTTDRVVINVRADRSAPQLDQWQMPKLIPLDVAGFAAVVGVLIEEQLNSRSLDATGLIAIDNQILAAALPESVLIAEPGMPRVRPLATYYAAQAEFELNTSFLKKPPQLFVTTNLLLTINDRRLEVDGGFALLPESEKLFSFEFNLPAGWAIESVRTPDGAPLAFERYGGDTGTRVRVQLPGGLNPRETRSVLFHASLSPTDWLSDWSEQTIALPVITIDQSDAAHESGAIAVRATDDLQVRPATSSGLIVLSDNEKSKYGYGDVPTDLAWRYSEEDWEGTLVVTRKVPRMTGRVFSFFQIAPEALTSHFELLTDVEQARTQRLSFSLPDSTPAEITIRGMDDAIVKGTSSQIIDGRRLWFVQLAEKKTGRIRLAIDFVQPVTEQALRAMDLPDMRVENVAYQSGLIALEGHPEIDVTISQHPRSVDMGELIDAEYQVRKRLLAVFSYVGNGGQTTVDAVRRTIHPLPTTIVQRAELVSLVGAGGVSQTAARYLLRTKATYLEVRLPEGAALWSVMVDGQPTLPERQGEKLVIALAAAPPSQTRDLQIVFEHSIDRLLLRGEIELVAPTLWQREESNAVGLPVPLADLRWELVLPAGYRLVHTGGTVTPIESDRPRTFSWSEWFGWLDTIQRTQARITAGKTLDRKYSFAAESMSESPSGTTGTPQPASGPTPPQASLSTDDRFRQKVADQPSQAPPSQLSVPAPQSPAAEPTAAESTATVTDVLAGSGSAATSPKDSRFDDSAAWTLAGIRPLAIDLATANIGQRITFTSLGVDPILRATVMDQRRWQWLGLACGLTVLVVGLLRVPNRLTVRLRAIGWVVLIALLFPPLTGWSAELQPVAQWMLVGAAALFAVTIVGWLARGFSARWSRRRARAASLASSTSAVVSLWVCCFLPLGGPRANAQKPNSEPATVSNVAELEALIAALPGAAPVPIPSDAIVVPYDPDMPEAVARADKLLVPYDTYAQLWNAAHPEQQLKITPAVAAFAWSGAEYQAVLDGDNDLKIKGRLSIHVLVDGNVSVPLAIGGGVLESLTVDGASSQLQIVQASASPPNVNGKQSEPLKEKAPEETLLLLHLNGKGRKELAIQISLKIEKRGGWRVIEGRLPTAPATRLTLHVPQAASEVRLTGLADQSVHETDAAEQTIETALPSHGRVGWQWRAKIAEASVDQGLSVIARSAFEVQEDALKFAWHADFQFRRGRRESFTLLVPGDYLVEKVVGSNVRGWSIEPVDGKQQLTVDLLTTVAERESLTLFMMREHNGPIDQVSTISTPVIEVPDAMLQQGQLAVRRSSLLNLQTNEVTGLRRIDTPDNSQWLTEQVDASPLPLKAYQAFDYAQVPYTLELTAEPTASRVQVTAQTLLKLSQLESTLESRLIFQIQDRPLHQVRLTIPGNWKLQPPQVPVAYEWNVEPTEDGRQSLELYFASGLLGETSLVLRGTLAQSLSASESDGAIPPVPLPRIEVENMLRQSGGIVVTSDPAFDVRAEQLQGCETVLLGLADSWLAASQRSLARLMIQYDTSDMTGQLRVSLRAPQVKAFSVTNIKLTDRSIEETVLIEFTIRAAGIRRVSVIVPSSLAQAQVRGPLIRSQTWTPVSPEADSPVRLQVELQEDVMGQYSLIIENDRLLTTGEQPVPIPIIETGLTEHRFVTLENAGRDELLVAQRRSLEPLERSQAQWRFLSNLLGGKATEAFVVRESADEPLLSFATKERAVVETVGARIGIAQTIMVVDENGTYRAMQEYRIENRTEQFLEVEMPAGSRLWTVIVAGEPVKPVIGSQTGAGPTTENRSAATGSSGESAGPQRVRVPLVKTAAGDLDYSVTIKYGGQMPRPGGLRTTVFPLVKTINLHVELSQVRLRLPDTKRWLNFGGSMGQVMSQEELTAGWLSFRTRQLNELTQLFSTASDHDFSRARAMNNLKLLGEEVQELQRQSTARQVESRELQRQLSYNNQAWFDAQQQISEQSGAQVTEGAEQRTNRTLLNQRFAEQNNDFSVNVANESGDNFEAPKSGVIVEAATDKAEFDAAWLAGNSLKGRELSDAKSQSLDAAKKENVMSRLGTERLLQGREAGAAEGKPGLKREAAAKPAAPKIATQGRQPAESAPITSALSTSATEGRAEQIYRYQQRLEQQVAQAPRDNAAQFGAGGGLGGVARNDFANLETDRMISSANEGLMDLADGESQGDVAQAGYLTSLETELPNRGVEVLFTTPRGEIEITAQSISTETVDRLMMIAGVLAGALIVWLLSRAIRGLAGRRQSA